MNTYQNGIRLLNLVGDGRLIDHLEKHGGKCSYACDIEPQRDDIHEFDALRIRDVSTPFIITNPPWDRTILHRMIDSFTDKAPDGYCLMQIGCIQNNQKNT